VNGEEQGEQGGANAKDEDGLCRYRHIRHVAVDREHKDELDDDGDGGLYGLDVCAHPVKEKVGVASTDSQLREHRSGCVKV